MTLWLKNARVRLGYVLPVVLCRFYVRSRTVDIWYFNFEFRYTSEEMSLNAAGLVQFRMIAQSCKDTWRVSYPSVIGYDLEVEMTAISPLYQIYLMTNDTKNLVEERLRMRASIWRAFTDALDPE